MCSKKFLYCFAIGLLIMGVFLEEAEGRRKILRGRKVLTRRYYRSTAIPAWSIVVISGFGMLLLGGILFFVLHKYVIDKADVRDTHSYQPALQNVS